jgi:hypothetical protein
MEEALGNEGGIGHRESHKTERTEWNGLGNEPRQTLVDRGWEVLWQQAGEALSWDMRLSFRPSDSESRCSLVRPGSRNGREGARRSAETQRSRACSVFANPSTSAVLAELTDDLSAMGSAKCAIACKISRVTLKMDRRAFEIADDAKVRRLSSGASADLARSIAYLPDGPTRCASIVLWILNARHF